MNLFDLAVAGTGDGLRLCRGDLSLRPPVGLGRVLAAEGHRRIALGLRPPSILRAPLPGGGDHCLLSGTVLLSELLGDDVLVYVRTEGDLEVRTVWKHEDWKGETGAIRLAFPHERLYAFDTQGDRIRW